MLGSGSTPSLPTPYSPPVNDSKTVLICQHNACRKVGAAAVLTAFEANSPPPIQIQPVRCLGQCGNGAMVLILPEQVWYDRVQPDEVPIIIDRHLKNGKPIQAMLYKKFHPS
ncbi:ferredoxin [filamentous cyanobacterium CCP2]|nr:ferredoxin [filamentous cyanobacterium CCP2]